LRDRRYIDDPQPNLPLFRNSGVADTSAIAYRELVESGRHGTQVRQILDLLDGSDPMTLREIQKKTGMDINAVSGRVNDLKKQGLLFEWHKRKCSVTGRLVTPVGCL